MDRCSAVETDAAAFGGISSCSFVEQGVKGDSNVEDKITSSGKTLVVVFLPQKVSR